MTDFNNTNIGYLEVTDITGDGKLKPHITNGKTTMVMCQGTYCGYCTQAKPDYIKLSKEMEEQVSFRTIQIDGSQSEQEVAKFIPTWYKEYRGVPVFLVFNRDGSFKKTHSGGRDFHSLKSSLM